MALPSSRVLLLLAVCLTRVQSQSSTQTDQQRLLSQRYAVTNWDEYYAANNYVGWVDDNTVPVCTWTGVYCSPNGAIEELRFQCPNCAVKAIGSLAQNLSQILTFKTLNVQQQMLGGPLPEQFGLNGSFPNLINLLVQQNYFTGTIPPSWYSAGAFPNVQLMTFQLNDLTGPLPEPESWPNLQVLRLHQNQFTGTLPGSWGESLPNVQIISMHQNRLQGPLPAAWAANGAFQQLEELYLQNNTLKGQLPGPAAAATFPRLKTLDLSYNSFAGTLPAGWGERAAVPSLELLFLRSIGLNGTLPASWGAPGHGMNELRELWLDGNDLSGTIPAEWSALTSLEMLYVKPGNARLCGPLPPNLPFKICDASGNEFCNLTASLDGPTCPPWKPPPSLDSGADSSKTGAIVGGVVGGVVGGALLAFAAVFFVRRRRRQQQRMSPFIAEASTSLEPSKNDMSGYAKTLQSLEGGAGDAGADVASWPKRMLQRASSLCGTAGSVGVSVQPGPSLPTDGGAAPAAGLAGQAGAVQRLAADQPGRIPGPTSEEGFLFNNSSVLLTTDMSVAAAAAASAAALPPPGAPTGLTTRGRLSHASNFSAQPSGSGELQVLDPGVQQLSDWEIQPEEIEYMKRPDGSNWELGCGGFGKVYKALRNSAQPVAVKVLTSGPDARYMAMNEFRREVAILKACRDPNIVAFLGACMRDDCAMLVTEYCEGGNLARNIVARKVNWYRRGRKIALDIAKGLVFLHSRRIVHLDLKSPNILLSRDGTAKIADVGLAKIIAHEYSAVTGAVGTLAWSSPEMLLGARCTEKSDIYSYGVVLWEIATGQTPIRGQLRDVKVPEECPEELRKLMLDCLEQNPRRRPSAQQVIERLRKIPVSSREHAPALPPNMLRPSTPGEAAAEAAAKAKSVAATATVAAAAATAAAQQAAAEKEGSQQRQERAGQRGLEHQLGGQQGQESTEGHAGAAAGLTPLLASDPSSPGSPGSQAPVSAFAAAAAAAPVGTSTPTPRTASNASELLTGAVGSCLQSPPAVPGGFMGAAIAPAGSLPTPFSNKLAAAGGELLLPALEKQPSSAGGTHLPAWSSSDELGSRDPRSSYDQRSSLELSRAASGALQGPSAQATGTPHRTVGVTPGRRGSIPLPPGAPGSGRASPFVAARDSLSPPATD